MKSLGTDERPLRVALVGAGPTGFYTADKILKSSLSVQVDLFEKWPVPYGLVRTGVAPDKQNTKNVTRLFERIAGNPAVRYLGHVEIGCDLTIEELRRCYDAVVLTCGASSHRSLGIPGESLAGSYSANEFVGWYNGDLRYQDLAPDLSCETAVIIGNGNVAMDVTRILARPAEVLAESDITPAAAAAIGASRLKRICVVGRRGPVQGAFTHPELQELGQCPPWTVHILPEDLVLNPASKEELKDESSVHAKNNLAVMEGYTHSSNPGEKNIEVLFLQSPVSLEGHKKVEAITLEKNGLDGKAFHQRAIPTGVTKSISCGLVVRCIGYKGEPVPGLPFDEKKGVLPNQAGRLMDGDKVLPGMYAAGWIKHGPVGLIATSKKDAAQVATDLIADVAHLPGCEDPTPGSIEALLKQRGVQVVDFSGWKRIDEAEVQRGQAVGKPREKFISIEAMLGQL